MGYSAKQKSTIYTQAKVSWTGTQYDFNLFDIWYFG